MKFSKTLFENKEIASVMFNNSINKASELLSNIFNLDFISKNNITEIDIDKNNYIYIIDFQYNKRYLRAELKFEENNDILNEVIMIKEFEEEKITLGNKEFKENVNYILEYIERRFDIEVTPIFLDEIFETFEKFEITDDELILHFNKDSNFVTVYYNHINPSEFIIKNNKCYKIYFD